MSGFCQCDRALRRVVTKMHACHQYTASHLANNHYSAFKQKAASMVAEYKNAHVRDLSRLPCADDSCCGMCHASLSIMVDGAGLKSMRRIGCE